MVTTSKFISFICRLKCALDAILMVKRPKKDFRAKNKLYNYILFCGIRQSGDKCIVVVLTKEGDDRENDKNDSGNVRGKDFGTNGWRYVTQI